MSGEGNGIKDFVEGLTETGSRCDDRLTVLFQNGEITDIGLPITGAFASLANTPRPSGKTLLEEEKEHWAKGTWTSLHTSDGKSLSPERDEAFEKRGHSWLMNFA